VFYVEASELTSKTTKLRMRLNLIKVGENVLNFRLEST